MHEYKKTMCSKCIYRSGRFSGTNFGIFCDYIGFTGRMRPCKAGECKEKGVFVAEKKKRRPKAKRVIVHG